MRLSPVHSDERAAARSIWVFTPSRTDPADLEAILVQRHALLKDSVERVRESALTPNKHHLLFVGARGCGKTHLVTLIVSRISADTQASRRLRLAWLNEDETCTSLLELLIKIHSALEKRYPEEFRANDLSEVYEHKPPAALDWLKRRLLASLGTKTLVVVTENLDALFESMGDEGQKQLRALIQEHPQFAIVATAQRLVEGLSNRSSPFFGFFQTEHLKSLSVVQATALLQNIARHQGRTEVAEFLDTSRGRSRVRALHHLSGGNHRIYIVLAQFITLESVDALIGPFLKMVDELTPYYQERVRWLPPLQRKIVELLCACEGTVPVKEIARRLFSSQQTISSQLQNLREKGYVESNQRGRESLYEISEPLMRICVEVKENQNTRPLSLLVDFLRVWYDDSEINQRLGFCVPTSPSREYLSAALERNGLEGNLKIRMLAEEALGSEYATIDAERLARLLEVVPEDLLIALQYGALGDNETALKCIEDALINDVPEFVRAGILYFRGGAFAQKGDSPAAIADYARVIGMRESPPGIVAMALYCRGFLLSSRGDNPAAITDVTRIVEMPDAPPDEKAKAFNLRGIMHVEQGDSAAAIDDFSRVIEIPEASLELVAMAHCTRGSLLGQQGDSTPAITDYTRVIAIPETPPEFLAAALCNRGVLFGNEGDYTAAFEDFSRVIEMLGSPPEPLAMAFCMRGILHFQVGNTDASQKDFEALNSVTQAPAEILIDGHRILAQLHFNDGRWNEGFAAIEACLGLGAQQSPPNFQAPTGIIAALFSAGLSQEGRGIQAGRLHSCYAQYSAVAVLGEALVKHLGAIYTQGDPWPTSDNLDQWLLAWEQAAEDARDFQLPLRLLRTGIEFIKSGGKDDGVLLDLLSTERSILRQAFGLENEGN